MVVVGVDLLSFSFSFSVQSTEIISSGVGRKRKT